jgi:thymidylate kinase
VLIAFEGPDGVGKTTIRRHVFRRLCAAGKVAFTTWPYSFLDVDAAEVITSARWLGRSYSEAELLRAYARDAMLLGERIVAPQVMQGKIVMLDRYLLSMLVYNRALYGIDPARMWSVFRAVGVLRPDLTVVVTAPLEQCMERIGRSTRAHRWETAEVQADVHRLYPELLSHESLAEACRPATTIENSGSLEDLLRSVDSVLLPAILAADRPVVRQ